MPAAEDGWANIRGQEPKLDLPCEQQGFSSKLGSEAEWRLKPRHSYRENAYHTNQNLQTKQPVLSRRQGQCSAARDNLRAFKEWAHPLQYQTGQQEMADQGCLGPDPG